MHKRVFALLAVVMLLMAACGPAAQSPSADASPDASVPESAPATSESAAASPGGSPASEIDELLFGTTYVAEEGTPGGTVVIADWQQADQLNPYLHNAFRNTQVHQATMRGLWTVSNDGKWTTDLAQTVPTIANGGIVLDEEPTEGGCEPVENVDYTLYPEELTPGFTITLDIKPDLTWSDGEALDLNDARYTWMDWILDPEQTGLVAGTTGYDLIDSFEVAEDGLTADVHFCRGFAAFYGVLSMPLLPEHYMSEIPIAEVSESSYPFDETSVDAPVSGPFKYASVGGTTAELVRNDEYNSCVGEGCTPHPAYLERVIYQFYPDNKDGMIAAFLNGEVDVATDLLQGDYPAIEAAPEGFEATIEDAWEYEHFDINQSGEGPEHGHPALADPLVRQALGAAIDKTGLYEFVYPGVPLPETEPCSPTSPGLYYHTSEGLTCPEYDPEAAAALLDEAGWTDTNGDGTRDKDGVELVLLHCHTDAPFRNNAGDFLAAGFAEIGIGLTNTATAAIFDAWNDTDPTTPCNINRGTFDTAEFAYVQGFDIFGSFYYTLHSTQIPTEENGGNGANIVRLQSDEMDSALDTLFGTTDPAEVYALAAELQALHSELQPEIVLYYRSGVRGLNTSIANFARNPGTSTDMWNIEDWYLTSS